MKVVSITDWIIALDTPLRYLEIRDGEIEAAASRGVSAVHSTTLQYLALSHRSRPRPHAAG